MRILVIDDEQPTLKMFALILTALGHSPVTASSGEEGLRLFDDAHPDVVLTDIKMPGMDGMDVLRSLKEADPRCEVIVITGHGDVDLAIEALHLDATDFINKPVRREELVTALERAADRIRLKHDCAESIRCETSEDGAVVRVVGTVSGQGEAMLRHAFEETLLSGAPRVTLAFGESTALNGAAITTLTTLLGRAATLDREVHITGASDNLRTVFEVMGFGRLFDPLRQDDTTP